MTLKPDQLDATEEILFIIWQLLKPNQTVKDKISHERVIYKLLENNL